MLKLNTNNIIEMYNNGIPTTIIANEHNCSVHAIINCLKRSNVYAGRDWKSYIWRKYMVKPVDLMRMYESGMWKNEIAEATGISEGAVGIYLAKLGIPIAENRADAMSSRIARMSSDEIAVLTAPAHEAVRGMKRTESDLVKRAQGKERVGKMVGKAEKDLYVLMVKAGLSPIPQKAIWKYNIDFMLKDNIAVEVTGRNRKPEYWPIYRERIKYLLDSKLALVYVWANTIRPVEIGAAEYLVSFCERASRDPSVFGKYFVIRRDGKLLTTGGVDSDEFPGILTAVPGTYART